MTTDNYYNKQLADYVAKAIALVPEGELISSVEADNNVGKPMGAMLVWITTLVPSVPCRRFYCMNHEGLGLVGEEIEL